MACLHSYGGSDFYRAPFGILPRQISRVHDNSLA